MLDKALIQMSKPLTTLMTWAWNSGLAALSTFTALNRLFDSGSTSNSLSKPIKT